MVAEKDIADNQDGQAIMEFLAFVPFILGMLMLYLKIGSAINGSINQQKVIRRFLYHLEKGNAFTPTSSLLFNDTYSKMQFVEYSAVGWQEKRKGISPIAPCYQMPGFLQEVRPEGCEKTPDGSTSTMFLKIYSVYGVCGTSYQKSPLNEAFWINNWNSASSGRCGISGL